MSPETIVIVGVGSAATLFLLSCSFWLWRHAPPPSPRTGGPLASTEVPPKNAAGDPKWMGWAPASDQEAPNTQPPLRPRRRVEQLDAVQPTGVPISPAGPDAEIDGARTMFFFKKKPSSEKTEIIADGHEGRPDPDAPVTVDQLRTTPNRRSRRPPPPPPPSVS